MRSRRITSGKQRVTMAENSKTSRHKRGAEESSALRTNDAKLDIVTLRALVAIQPKGKAELARAVGIALPNLSNFLKSGQETLV